MRAIIPNRKGQTAMDSIMITLLIIASAAVISSAVNKNKQEIDQGYEIRLALQEIAIDLSIKEGKQTELIRIDPLQGGQYRVWLVSADCAEVRNRINNWDTAKLIYSGTPDGIQCKKLFYNQLLPK